MRPSTIAATAKPTSKPLTVGAADGAAARLTGAELDAAPVREAIGAAEARGAGGAAAAV